MSEEHVLVCLSTAPSNGNIIRTAAKMASAFDATLTALYVRTTGSEKLSGYNAQRLQEHVRLAEKLGAEVTTVHGDDVAFQIAAFARAAKVTKIVLGRSSTPHRYFWEEKPLNEKLVELLPQLDIYIIPDTAGENRRGRRPSLRRPWHISGRELLISAALLAAASATGLLFDSFSFTHDNIITVYILGVLLASLFTRSYACGVLTSLAGMLLFNFLFTAPRFTLRAYDPGALATFGVMLAASLITATLANRLSEHAKQSAESAAHTKVLFETSRLLQKATGDADILHLTAEQLVKLLNRPLIVYGVQDGALDPGRQYAPDGVDSVFPYEPEIAHWAYRHRKRAGAGTESFPEAQGLYLSLRSGTSVYGVVGIYVGKSPLEPFENSVLLSILNECALALENDRHIREKEQAAILAKNEQLRANLLRTISHDLRTPLTSISGNAENLLKNNAVLPEETKGKMVSDIYDDAVWLTGLVENLLSITRMGEGAQLQLSLQLMDEVITEALRHIGRKAESYRLVTEVSDELLPARMDARLISQVIINLVDNAIKYTPPGSTITVRAYRDGDVIAVSVSDTGPGIDDDQKEKVFDMFFTGEHPVADCHRSLGLGLALCKTIITAHSGTIHLTDNVPHGAIFTFTIPASEVMLHE